MTRLLASDIEDIFDRDWYVSEYPDVKAVGIDPIEHYLLIGRHLGRKPSADFDPMAYLAANPDVAAQVIDPVLHYIRWGRNEGRRLFPPNSGDQHPAPAPQKKENTEKEIFLETLEEALNLDLLPVQDEGEATAPHYGVKFHQLVCQARTRSDKQGASIQYDTILLAFDFAYYIARYPDIAKATKLDLVEHYIEHGTREGRDPSPHFSTKHYLKRYPDVEKLGVNPFYHWLAVGRREGRIAAPFADFDEMCSIIGLPPQEVQETLIARRNDLRQRFEHGKLGEMMAKAAKIEPLIAHSWRETFATKFPPFHTDQVVSCVTAIHKLHQEAEFRRAKAIVVIPHCRLSGGGRLASYLAFALAEIYGPDELVIVRTDLDILRFPEWFPAGCRHLNLAGATERLNDQHKRKVLVDILRALRPQVVFNVNSRLLWETLSTYGKALSSSMALYAYFFCNDKSLYGYWTGYPLTKFYRHFDILAGVVTDSHALVAEISGRYIVPPDQRHKIATLETPIFPQPELAPAPPRKTGRRRQVFWAGRFDQQKRVDIVYAVAARLPEIHFRLWGESVIGDAHGLPEQPQNVTQEGVYDGLSQLPVSHCDLWLYTSEWDGVPNMLIEVAAMGIPLVGSVVGGTGEILQEGLSERIEDIEDVEAYVTAIRAILANPARARKRAAKLRDMVIARRAPAVYRDKLQTILPPMDRS